jgi:hypothetical protein
MQSEAQGVLQGEQYLRLVAAEEAVHGLSNAPDRLGFIPLPVAHLVHTLEPGQIYTFTRIPDLEDEDEYDKYVHPHVRKVDQILTENTTILAVHLLSNKLLPERQTTHVTMGPGNKPRIVSLKTRALTKAVLTALATGDRESLRVSFGSHSLLQELNSRHFACTSVGLSGNTSFIYPNTRLK